MWNRTVAALLTGACLAAICGGSAQAERGLRISSSRTYVENYMVVDGFLIPVTGVVTNEVSLTVGPVRTSPPQGAVVGNREELDRFFMQAARRDASPARQEAAKPGPQEPRPVSPRRAPRPGPRTTTKFGALRYDADGNVVLVVKSGSEQITYALDPDGPARQLLEKSGEEEIQSVVIGKISDDDPAPILRVTSAKIVERQLR